jgi:hypothetical protein
LFLIGLATLTTLTTTASVASAADNRSGAAAGSPVLRSYEPAENGVFRLPGPPAPAAPIERKILPVPPAASALPPPSKPLLVSVPPKPVAAPVKPELPAEVIQEVGFYCQKHVGQWKAADARKLLGVPLRSRAAADENQAANGRIYAFRDPIGRYRELELDFDGKTGTRKVFAYPPKMSWQEAHRRWAGEVNSADAPQGASSTPTLIGAWTFWWTPRGG